MATSSVTCTKCGNPNVDLINNNLCPQCGSTVRVCIPQAHIKGISFTSDVQLELATYPQTLLSIARWFIDNDQYSIAVVVAHMACEFATERAFSEAFAKKKFQTIKDMVMASSGYNLNNERIQKIYTSLTDDEVQKQAFWQNFKESTKRRNDIVHEGKQVDKTEAEKSFQVANDLVSYLNK